MQVQENLKSRLTLILGILTVIFFISTVSSCGNAYRNRMAQLKETVQRKEVEEKLNKLSQEKAGLEESLAALQKQIDETMVSLETTKSALLQEQLVNQSLKEELDKISKLKEALEEDLKEVLMTGKGSSAVVIPPTRQ